MKKIKFLSVTLVALVLCTGSVFSQGKKFDSYVVPDFMLFFDNVECIGEWLVGEAYVEVQYPKPTHSVAKISGTFYGVDTGREFEVRCVNPGHNIWSEKTGWNLHFNVTWQVLSGGQLFAIVISNVTVRANPANIDDFDKWIIVENFKAICK